MVFEDDEQAKEPEVVSLEVTDEDLVPLDLFDGVIAELKHKVDSRKQV